MNKRIQLIAEQVADNLDPEDCMVSEEFLEKYTKLIVRECSKVLVQHGAYFSGHGEPYHYAASLIEEHFGVEE